MSSLLIPATQPSSEKDPLVRYGYTRQVNSGTYHLLPLGQKVSLKLESLLRHHMNSVGGAEVSLSSMSSPALWAKTGRNGNTELFRLKDGKGTEYLLAPTHEEEITNMVAKEVETYKKLPLRLYQITRKFRDERRPRGGLLRAREFIMKDMYSFDLTTDDAKKTYNDVQGAYNAFFKDLGVPFVVAEADSGAIGGNLSHEYHYLTEVGEDTVFSCQECHYTANEEKIAALPAEDQTPAQTAKVEYRISDDGHTLLAAYYPSDRQFNPLLLDAEIDEYLTPDISVKSSDEAFEKFRKTISGPTDLLSKRFIRLMDPRLDRNTELPELHFLPSRATTTTLIDIPLVTPETGDLCPSCDKPSLHQSRAVEIGHTFYLGKKYSSPLDATVSTPTSMSETVEMGCYGIGVSRLIGVLGHMLQDEDGLRWPTKIAPFAVTVVGSDAEIAMQVAKALQAQNPLLDILVDDRNSVSFGQKMKEVRRLGIPVSVIAGKNFLKEGLLEIQGRDGTIKSWKEKGIKCQLDSIGSVVGEVLKGELGGAI